MCGERLLTASAGNPAVYELWQLPKTGGFASPPLDGFANYVPSRVDRDRVFNASCRRRTTTLFTDTRISGASPCVAEACVESCSLHKREFLE